MRCKQASFVAWALVVSWYASAPYPAIGFAGPISVARYERPPKTPANLPAACEQSLDGRSAQTKKEAPEQSSVLLCTQYSIALQQCFIALQGLKTETEAELLSMFQACLKGRNFATEPNVCRRSVVSPKEAVKIILRGRHSGILDFRRYHDAPEVTLANTSYSVR